MKQPLARFRNKFLAKMLHNFVCSFIKAKNIVIIDSYAQLIMQISMAALTLKTFLAGITV